MKSYTELMHDALALRKDPRPSAVAGGVTLDSAGGGDSDHYGDYDDKRLALAAAASVQTWAEDDELGDGETFADRLFALLIGVADENKDGELSDDEQEEFADVCEYAGQYLTRHGVDEDDAMTLLSEWDDDTAERVRDIVLGNLPESEDAISDMNDFAFSSVSMDSASFKAMPAVEDGKKVMKRFRVSGRVTMTPRQKAAFAKVRMKSHSSSANRKRKKSMKVRQKLRLKPRRIPGK